MFASQEIFLRNRRDSRPSSAMKVALTDFVFKKTVLKYKLLTAKSANRNTKTMDVATTTSTRVSPLFSFRLIFFILDYHGLMLTRPVLVIVTERATAGESFKNNSSVPTWSVSPVNLLKTTLDPPPASKMLLILTR